MALGVRKSPPISSLRHINQVHFNSHHPGGHPERSPAEDPLRIWLPYGTIGKGLEQTNAFQHPSNLGTRKLMIKPQKNKSATRCLDDKPWEVNL